MAESSDNNNADMAFPSPYLRNPVPFFNSGDDEHAYTHLQGSPPSVQQSREGLPLLDEKKVRAAVAELLVFGFKGTSLNRHARSLISMGKLRFPLPNSIELALGFFELALGFFELALGFLCCEGIVCCI
jgi:hypothetical protein